MAKKVAIICDSTADFPIGMAEQLGLHILPVHIFVDGKDHLHGRTIDNHDVIQKLKEKHKVHTAPFYPYECAELFERLLKNHDEVVSFHLSSKLSGNYKSACSALQLMGEAARRVHVFDLSSVSISLGLVVKKAVNLLNSGVEPASLKQHLMPYLDGVFLSFTVDNLTWLKQGGRVNAIDAFIGNIFDFKPIIQLQDAGLVPTERHRGKKPALKGLVSTAEETYKKMGGNCEVWMAYADNLDEIMTTREKLARSIGRSADSIPLAEVGATISVHTGPGSAFIAMVPQ